MESNIKNPSSNPSSSNCCHKTACSGLGAGKVISILLAILVVAGLTVGMKIAGLSQQEHDDLNRWIRSWAPAANANNEVITETVVVTEVEPVQSAPIAPAPAVAQSTRVPEATHPVAAPATTEPIPTPVTETLPADAATQAWVNHLAIDSFIYRASHSKFSIGASIYTIGSPIPGPYNLTWTHVATSTPGHYTLTFTSPDGQIYKKEI